MLTTPNSPLNRKAINKQLRFIQRGLRTTRCIVAGGAPRDHLDGVAAADLDFYVPDMAGAAAIAGELNIPRLQMIWSLENRPASSSGVYSDGTSEQYLQSIFEGVASHLGDTVKVNIMILQPQFINTTRSDLIVNVLKHFPEGTSHHVYTIHGGDVLLMQNENCVRIRSTLAPEEYKQKVLRKLMLRNSPLLEAQLRAGHSPWVCADYYLVSRRGNLPMMMCLNRGAWACRKVTQRSGVGLRTAYQKYSELRSLAYHLRDIDIDVFNKYEEGEITYEQYVKYLEAETERRRNVPKPTVTFSTGGLSTLRSTSIDRDLRSGSLS
jgi:hypothetical protein